MSPHPIRRLVGRGKYMLREFRWPLCVFAGLVLLAGALFSTTMHIPYGKACFGVYMLIFVQPNLEWPEHQWYNQVLFFIIPIVGLGAVADSVVRLGYLIFARKRKLQEWWIMEASICRNHIVLCGLGRVGYRIAEELLGAKESLVAIEKDENSVFVEELQDKDVPVLIGDARLKKNMLLANLEHAKAVICATNDDLANLDSAMTAREIKPEIRVVLRLFDETLATKVASQFKMPVISTSQVSAPAFVAAVTGRSVHQCFQLDGHTIHVADLRVFRLPSQTVASLQKQFGVSVLLLKKSTGRNFDAGSGSAHSRRGYNCGGGARRAPAPAGGSQSWVGPGSRSSRSPFWGRRADQGRPPNGPAWTRRSPATSCGASARMPPGGSSTSASPAKDARLSSKAGSRTTARLGPPSTSPSPTPAAAGWFPSSTSVNGNLLTLSMLRRD
jgi:Trk K+ transport system NAD-binding subunit